jgi:hypothetical protein
VRDSISARMVEALGTTETQRFVELLRPIRRGLLDGGAFASIGR